MTATDWPASPTARPWVPAGPAAAQSPETVGQVHWPAQQNEETKERRGKKERKKKKKKKKKKRKRDNKKAQGHERNGYH